MTLVAPVAETVPFTGAEGVTLVTVADGLMKAARLMTVAVWYGTVAVPVETVGTGGLTVMVTVAGEDVPPGPVAVY